MLGLRPSVRAERLLCGHSSNCGRRPLPACRRTLTQQSPAPRRLAFAFDIDGVLKQGKIVLPEAKRALGFLSGKDGRLKRPVPYLLMTNGGGMTEHGRAKALSRDFDVTIGTDMLVQSHTPLQGLIDEFKERPVLVVGCEGDAGRRIAESYGLKQVYIPQDIVAWNASVWDRYHLSTVEKGFVKTNIDIGSLPFAAVLVIHDAGMDWALATQLITELIMSDGGHFGTSQSPKPGELVKQAMPIFFTNPDLIYGSDYPLPRLGMGAFRVSLEAAYKELTGTSLAYTQIGKPHTATYAFAERMLRTHLEKLGAPHADQLSVYMVGDNPASDIAGANGHGWNSALVRTGVYRGGEPAHKPTIIVDNVEQAVAWAFDREMHRP